MAICNNPSGERDTMEPKGTIDWTNLQIWGKRRKKQKTKKKKCVLCVAHCRRVWSRAGSRLSLREGDETPPSKSKYYIETNCTVFLHGETVGEDGLLWARAGWLVGWRGLLGEPERRVRGFCLEGEEGGVGAFFFSL